MNKRNDADIVFKKIDPVAVIGEIENAQKEQIDVSHILFEPN